MNKTATALANGQDVPVTNAKQFDLVLATLRTEVKKGSKKPARLDVEKIKALSDVMKERMLNHLVRHRQPVVVEFIGPLTDISWLNAMAYMKVTKGPTSGFTFRHRDEDSHKIR